VQVIVATGFELLMQNIWHGLHFASDNKRITISPNYIPCSHSLLHHTFQHKYMFLIYN